MTTYSSVNQSPTTGSDAIYDVKQVLSSSGWTIVSSSNGTTAAEGDSWSSSSDVAHSYSWTLMRSPDDTRYFTMQRGTDSRYWRFKYLSGSYNMDGTGTHTPTAVSNVGDLPELVFVGGGTDASPTFGMFFDTDNTYHTHIVANSSSPYEWWFGAFVKGTAGPMCEMFFDPLLGALAEDPDPAVVRANGNNLGTGFNSFAGLSIASNGTPAYGIMGGSWTSIPGLFYVGYNVNFQAGMGTNSNSGKIDTLPVFYMKPSSEGSHFGYKGVSSLMRWVPLPTIARGDTLNLTSAKSHVVVSPGANLGFCLPWDGSSDFNV